MADREKVITNLQVIRTWAEVDGESGRGIDPQCCRKIVSWIDDAIALLKSQETRVMTLEEVRAAEVVWLEQCGTCVCAIKIQNFDNGTMSFAYEYNHYTSFINIKPEYYGKISRCWTSRPTDEQREGTPWES